MASHKKAKGEKHSSSSAASFVSNNKLIQFRLNIGAINDPPEYEADAIADKVMQMTEAPLVQRKCEDCEKEEQIDRKPLERITTFLQTKSEGHTTVGEGVENSIKSSKNKGSSLDENTQSFMSSRFGRDFRSVKIHTDNEAAQLSHQLNAQAFTVGNDIYFNEGKYAPGSEAGRHLLAHELTHTVQQGETHGALQKQDKEDKTFAPETEIDLKLLPPDFQLKLFHFLLEADSGKLHLDYQTRSFMAGLSYKYGDELSLKMRFTDFTTKLGWSPGDNAFSLSLSQVPFSAGLSAKPWQSKFGLNLSYGAPLLPMQDQMTSTFMKGGISAGNMLTGLPGFSADPLSWYSRYKSDIENVSKTVDLVKQITDNGKSKIKFGAGFSLTYDPENKLVVTGTVGITW